MISSQLTTDVLFRRAASLQSWSLAYWEEKALVILPAVSMLIGILALVLAFFLVVREGGSRRAVFAALASSALFYVVSNLLAMVSGVLLFTSYKIQPIRRLAVSSWILERFELILALTTALLLLVDSANSIRQTDRKRSWARGQTILKWVAFGLVGLAVAGAFVAGVLRGVTDGYVSGPGLRHDNYLRYQDAEFALYQFVRSTFIVALAAILALGVVLWRQFTQAGQRNVPTIAVTSIGVPLLFGSWVVSFLFGFDIPANGAGWFAMQVFNSLFSLAFYALILVLGFKKSVGPTSSHTKDGRDSIELSKHTSDSTPTINRPLKRSGDLEAWRSS